MKHWPIRWRVLFLALVPMGLLASALAAYFTKARIDEMDLALAERGASLVRQLAPLAEYGVFTANRALLQDLAESIRKEPDVRLVVITDAARQVLASSGDLSHYREFARRPAATLELDDEIYFSEPIRRTVAPLDDPHEQAAIDTFQVAPKRGQTLGQVVAVLSKTATKQEQTATLVKGGLIGLAGLLLTALVALRMTLGITRPVRRLVSAVERITQGDLTVRVEDEGGGELSVLARGINAMTGSLKAAQDNLQERIRSATEQLSYQASHDVLTGLINRREFETRLERALQAARQHGNVHALFFLDLDQFKIVNDTCGHNAGDELLRQIAHQLRQKIRERDTLARIGGDEFTVLLENCHLDDAVEVAQELRQAVQNFRFAWEEKVFAIGASIGIVMITQASETSAILLSQADSACYTAKDLGRNRIYVFNEDDKARLARVGTMEWITRITHAFQEDRFLLYCQSILPLHGAKEGEPYLHEILLRMRGEDGELIQPMAFIPSAERSNQMQAIDRWVIRQSLMTLRKVRDNRQGAGAETMFSINLSGASLCDEQFSVFLEEQLSELDIAPRSVCFEVTETAAISNLEHAGKLMTHFKRRGCRFVLDDFGAGLSSFNYLKHLPVDGIKIDGAFVRGMAVNRIDHAMVESINNIGHAMGLSTTAEFVEDDAIMRKLVDLGVDYAQGNWVQRPRLLAEWLANEIESRRNVDLKLRLIARRMAER